MPNRAPRRHGDTGYQMREQQTNSHGFIVELAAEAEVGGGEIMAEEHHDILSKLMDAIIGNLVESGIAKGRARRQPIV